MELPLHKCDTSWLRKSGETKATNTSFSSQEEEKTHQQKQQVVDQTSLGNQAGSIISRKASSWSASGQHDNHPVVFGTYSNSGIFSVIEILWVLWLCEVREELACNKVRNTSRHYHPLPCIADIQMAFSQKLGVSIKCRLRAWYSVGSCGICALLIIELVSHFLCKALCILILY